MKIVSGIQPAPRRIMMVGEQGVGKSLWASKAPRPIFLNLEDGLNDISCDRTELIKTYADGIAATEWLLRQEHKYNVVVVDSIDWFERIIQREICHADGGKQSIAEVGGGYGKGPLRVVPKWNFFLDQLDLLRTHRRMGIILISHAKVETVRDPQIGEYTRYSPDLDKNISSITQEWCDEVLFARFRVVTNQDGLAKGGKERVIVTSGNAAIAAKNRLRLPEELPMEWSAYAAYLPKAKPAAKPLAEPPITKPEGNIEGIVVDGSSKPKSNESPYDPQELAEVFG